jgi:hypothetical protein
LSRDHQGRIPGDKVREEARSQKMPSCVDHDKNNLNFYAERWEPWETLEGRNNTNSCTLSMLKGRDGETKVGGQCNNPGGKLTYQILTGSQVLDL